MREIVLEFERFLKNFLQKRFSSKAYGQRLLREAIFYSLMATSSRFRPKLCFAVSRLLGQEETKIFPWAGALEMIHCASLIHDDLPAMDNAKTRRGRACNHLKFGEDMAILAGDCLFVESFSLLSDPLFQKKQSEIIDLFTSKVGFHGLMGGQALDLKEIQGDKKNLKRATKGIKNQAQKTLLKLRQLKTGALIEACGLGPLVLWGEKSQAQGEQLWEAQRGTQGTEAQRKEQAQRKGQRKRQGKEEQGQGKEEQGQGKKGQKDPPWEIKAQAIKNFCLQLGIAYQVADDLKDWEKDHQAKKSQGRAAFFATKKTHQKELKERLNACVDALSPLGKKEAEELKNLSLSLLP